MIFVTRVTSSLTQGTSTDKVSSAANQGMPPKSPKQVSKALEGVRVLKEALLVGLR